MTGRQPRLTAAVLISGSGTNLQAFIDAVAAAALPIDLSVVISNRPDAYGLKRADSAGIDTICIDHGDFSTRERFDAALADTLDSYCTDVIVLAGFMRILTPGFVARYAGRILNIHPSLLPKYPGLRTHQRAIDAGDRWHGSTVHFVTEQLDGGPRVIQGKVAVEDDDDADTLAARVLEIEHRIYPRAVSLLADGRLQYRNGRAWLDGVPLDEPIQFDGKH